MYVHNKLIKELFYLFQVYIMTEYHNRIACLYLRVARNQQAFTISNQSANGCTFRQSYIFYRNLCDLRLFLWYKFGDVCIGRHQEGNVHHIYI